MSSINNTNSQMTNLRSNKEIPRKIPSSARWFLKILKNLKCGHLALTTPEHEHHFFGDVHQAEHVSLQIHDWRACNRILHSGDIGFAEAYEAGWISTNNLTALLRLAIRNEEALDKAIFGGKIMGLWYKIKHLLRPNTREGSRRNIHAHYDIGNDFYALWLDPTWTYSSGIFYGDFSISLQQSQYRKYQRIIDSLQLKAGDSVLEIGCGWGGFAEQAGLQGIRVHGITISPSQLKIAQARIEAQQLSHLVHLELCDYRDLQGSYDAVVSIEMFEAVGEKFWPNYFTTVYDRLKSNGRAMVQSITIDEARFERYRSGTDFIQQYIFPGGMLPSAPRFVRLAEKNNLKVEEQYAFGADYAETLRRWHHAFDESKEKIKTMGFDQKFLKIWQLYLTYCEAGFDEKRTNVVQFRLVKNA